MFEQAIVVGSGIAGLVSARVLADHFNTVIVLDSDTIPSSPAIRKAVPQGNHMHLLLAGGLDVLKSLFPKIETLLDEYDGTVARPSDWYAITEFGRTYRLSRFQPTPVDGSENLINMRMQSRPLLEHCIRQQVAALPNVTTRYGAKVTDVISAENSITGVRIGSQGEKIAAELVIDAAGRTGLSNRWLRTLGIPTPTESTIHCDLVYSSMQFEPDDAVEFSDAGFLISSARSGAYTRRAGSLSKIENGRWLVTLAGRLGDYPPSSLEGFLEFAGTLHSDILSDLLKRARPIGTPHRYIFPKSVRRHFENMSVFPEGLIPIGDSICHVNPVYGQGMSIACNQAAALGALLAERTQNERQLDDLWREYVKQAHEHTRAAWVFAAMRDFAKDGTTGDFPHEEDDVIRELNRLTKIADGGDPAAATLVDSIFDMRRPLSTLS